ncbi:Imm58 family immunity protein [Comamonas sp. MYb21]|uniref:Imm58 family immunity protein n=1 Tax=Comamonas sp. MYb21 TaxID=1848648 RepID=UPI0030B2E9FA
MSIINRWRIYSFVLSLCCIALMYRIFDQGITMTYVKASNDDALRQLILLRGVLEYSWLGLTEDEVLLRLNGYIESNASQLIVLKKDCENSFINFESYRFYFSNGRLVKIE